MSEVNNNVPDNEFEMDETVVNAITNILDTGASIIRQAYLDGHRELSPPSTLRKQKVEKDARTLKRSFDVIKDYMHPEKSTTLYLSRVNGSTYFATIGLKKFVVHACTPEIAQERLLNAGLRWESMSQVVPSNIY